MTLQSLAQLFDRRGGAGTVDHCEFCGAHVETCDCDRTNEEDEDYD